MQGKTLGSRRLGSAYGCHLSLLSCGQSLYLSLLGVAGVFQVLPRYVATIAMISLPFKAFLLVAQHGSITYAAQRLALSQPTITNYIRQIEQEYKIELFYRQGKGLVISPEGRALLPRIVHLQQEATQIEFMLRDYTRLLDGELRIGATGPYYIMGRIQAFKQRYPSVQMHYWQGNSERILNAIRHYELEIGTSSVMVDDDALERTVLARDELYFVCHVNHPLAKAARLRLAQIQPHAFLIREPGSMTRQAVVEAFSQAGLALPALTEMSSREAIHWALVQGMGCTLLPSQEIPPLPNLCQIALADHAEPMYEYLYYLKERKDTAVLHAFVQSLPNKGV